MGAALQPRGGVLKRAAWAAAAAVALVVGAVPLFSPAPLLRALAPRLTPPGATLSIERLSGSWSAGFDAEGVRVRGPGYEAWVRSVRLRLSWHDLLRRRLTIESLAVLEPKVLLIPALLKKTAASGKAFEVRALTLDGGQLEVRSERGSWRLNGVAARGRRGPGGWSVESWTARAAGAWRGESWSVSAAGSGMTPGEADARATFVVSGSSVSAQGTARLALGLLNVRADVDGLVRGVVTATARLSQRRGEAAWSLVASDGSPRRSSGRISGTAQEHSIWSDVTVGTAAFSARGVGSWRGESWNVRWSRLEARSPIALRSEAPFVTRLWSGGAAVEGLVLSGEGTRLEASAEIFGGRWRRLRGRLSADAEPWVRAGFWRSAASATLDARFDLSGALKTPRGSVSAEITRARYADVDAGRISLEASLDGERAVLRRFEWTLGPGRASLTGSVPLRLGAAGPDFELRARIAGFDASPLTRRLSVLKIESPRVDADVTLAREQGRLRLRGAGRAAAADIKVPAAAVDLGPAQADFETEGDSIVVRRGALQPPGKGARAFLTGVVTAAGPALRLTGEDLRFDTGAGLSGESDAVVDVGGTWRAPVVTGTAAVRRAQFSPLGKSAKKRVETAARAEPPRPTAAAMDLRVTFDRDVWYRERATAVELKGDVRLRKKPFEPARLLGAVETVRGDYVYFGRVFAVEEGHLRFGGGPIDEAVLAARGLYVDAPTRTKVTLSVTGTLSQPRLALSSTPPMEERDIIAFLAFGRPLFELSGQESRAIPGSEEAAKVLGDFISAGIREHLPPQLGLDVFRVNVQGGKPDLTVGRYLTKRWFVSYGQTMGQEGSKRVDTAYSLSPHWSVETENTTQGRNLVDLLFNWGFR